MDDLKHFLEQQQALAEMPQGDMDDYEARMRLRAKRRKLWKSDEHSASPSQKEREAFELSTYLQSMPAAEVDAHELSAEQKCRRSNDDTRETLHDGSNTGQVPAATSSRPPSYPGPMLTSSRREVNGAPNHDSLRKSIPSSLERGSSSSTPCHVPNPDDVESANADSGNDSTRSFLPEQDHLQPSGPPRRQHSKVSKNGRSNLREKVLKKRKDSDAPTTANASNVTSPSNSPITASPSSHDVRVRARRTLESTRKAKRVEKAQKEKEADRRKKEEDEEKRMTPREYAIRVQSKFAAYLEKSSREKLPLRDKAIFYIGGDYRTASQSTRKKMDLLRKKGATVSPTYDPEVVTHIVTEGNTAVTLKALGLKSLDEIPMHIPTLTWSWVSEGRPDSPEFWFAAFPSRIDASSDKTPRNLQAFRCGEPSTAAPVEDFSRIEDFTVANNTGLGESVHTSTLNDQDGATLHEKQSRNDPLAEFYEQARKDAAAESELLRPTDCSSDDDDPSSAVEVKKSGFTCDNKPVSPGTCVNQDIVDKACGRASVRAPSLKPYRHCGRQLSELEEINKTKISGDPREQRWRVFSYGKSIRAIKAYPKRIRKYEDAISIKGIGSKTADKIVEIIKTGDLGRIKSDNTEDVQAIKLFNDIYGVGLITAQIWYSMGCRTLEDVRDRKGGIHLSDVQEIGLKYYDDINTRIPRSEVEEVFNRIKSIALDIDPKLFFQLMGSYRRGAKTCGDIDILMTRPTDDGRTHQGVLRRLLKELHVQGIVTKDLAIPDDFNDLEQTYRGLCRRDEKSPRRRIDILAVPYHEIGGALIYYTGDDIFNRAIRYKAKSMGYSLSQHGLSTRVLRDHRGKNMVPAYLIASETEEEIFRILGVPWQEPHERIRA